DLLKEKVALLAEQNARLETQNATLEKKVAELEQELDRRLKKDTSHRVLLHPALSHQQLAIWNCFLLQKREAWTYTGFSAVCHTFRKMNLWSTSSDWRTVDVPISISGKSMKSDGRDRCLEIGMS